MPQDMHKYYLENEKDFIQIAKEAEKTPWELDGLLYNYTDYFITALN
jgi:thermostable 8-oxoguanine DNA glycosylase